MPVSFVSVSLLFLLILSGLHRGCCAHIASVLLPFAGLVRERLLYTEGITQGLFLEITPDGSVRAAHTPTSNCVLELRSVRAGHTVIRGVATSLFLCVNSMGHLRGQVHYADGDCTFREMLLDSYTHFLSPHTGLPVSLSSRQAGRKRVHMLSRFLPVLNTWFVSNRVEEDGGEAGTVPDLESDDPLGIVQGPGRHTVFSPDMH